MDGTPIETSDRLMRRQELFRETPQEWIRRVVLGVAWAIMPARLGSLPALLGTCVGDLVRPRRGLPDAERASARVGVVGIAQDLSVPTLVEAYRRGLFPGGHVAPVKWLTSPDRCVLFFDELHIAKRLRRQMRQNQYTVTFDRDFEGVIKACASRRDGRWHVTWITPRIMRAYAALFDAGYAHSFEVWNADGVLVGGGYGVTSGTVFSTESQFSHEPNTSKIGFTVLNWHLARWGFTLNDGKGQTPTITQMGFRLIPRDAFAIHAAATAARLPGRWTAQASPQDIADWEPSKFSLAAE